MQASAVEGKRHSLATDYIMKILGLDICADTVVGNDMLRGISGGQRKRVTTGKTFKHTIALILYIRSSFHRLMQAQQKIRSTVIVFPIAQPK